MSNRQQRRHDKAARRAAKITRAEVVNDATKFVELQCPCLECERARYEHARSVLERIQSAQVFASVLMRGRRL